MTRDPVAAREADAGRPLTVPAFDPDLHCAPLTLFGRLRAGAPPLLLDVRNAPSALRLSGMIAWDGGPWPFGRTEAVLVDDDGTLAFAATTGLHAAGHRQVRALYGGLDLYAFTLHPSVVPEPRFLIESSLHHENTANGEP